MVDAPLEEAFRRLEALMQSAPDLLPPDESGAVALVVQDGAGEVQRWVLDPAALRVGQSDAPVAAEVELTAKVLHDSLLRRVNLQAELARGRVTIRGDAERVLAFASLFEEWSSDSSPRRHL